jgi:hypothetical protein
MVASTMRVFSRLLKIELCTPAHREEMFLFLLFPLWVLFKTWYQGEKK